MTLMRNFKKSSVRQGYIIDQELPYHSEILSLHGFHFELKTVKTNDTFTFFMQVSASFAKRLGLIKFSGSTSIRRCPCMIFYDSYIYRKVTLSEILCTAYAKFKICPIQD